MSGPDLKQAGAGSRGWGAYGIPEDSGDGSAYHLPIPLTRNLPAQCVSERTALSISAVWACVTLLSDTISTLPLGLYKRTDTGRELATQHPLFRIFHRQPNPDMSISQFLGATMANILFRGMAYWEKQTLGAKVVGLEFLPTKYVTWQKTSTGEREYFYTDPKTSKRRRIPDDKLVKIPGFTMNGEDGLSAIYYGANMFGAAQAAEQAASGIFERGLMQTTFFKYPQILRQDQREEARETILQISGAVNAGEPVILEAGMEAGNLGISGVDAQLLESRAFSVEEICSWFRVQPFMIGRASQGQTNWGTGIEQQMIGFVTFTLRPWLKRIEQAIQKDVISQADKETYYAEFTLDALLRGDSTARASFYTAGLTNGWLTRNQVASLENLPHFAGGDEHTIQAGFVNVTTIIPPPKTEPTLPGATAATGPDVQSTALNGAQVTSLLALLDAAATGAMPSATVAAAIAAAFPALSDADIAAMMTPLDGFEAPPAAAPAGNFAP